MKKWLLTVFAATLTCGSALPVMADSTGNPATDHAYIGGNLGTLTVGASMPLHINFSGNSQAMPDLQVKTSLGTLNGQGSSVTLSPTDGTYPDVTLTSTVAGQATVNVYESGVLIGSTQVTFEAGALASISVQASPNNLTVGGTSMITITAVDAYGNPISDGTSGTTFNLTTTAGQLAVGSGINTANNGSTVTVGTHNGVAQAVLSDNQVGTATVSVSDINTIPADVSINGTKGTTVVSVPVNFTYAQAVSVTPVQDFKDTLSRPALELESERELMEAGVLHGDNNHFYFPTSTIKRSEFAEIVAQYMGLNGVATNLSGTQTKFADVSPSAWYDGAVAADAVLGYFHGDGTNFYPEHPISYAEVAMVLLNNLGIQTTGSWPDNAISYGQTNGLFNGLDSFSANQPATRGDVAIMVRNALHLVPPNGALNTGGKTLEAEELGYTWYGDTQPATVLAVPGTGVSVGNELEVQAGQQTTTLHLANTVQMAGADSLSDLMNKKIKYLTNVLGLVTYIEVTP